MRPDPTFSTLQRILHQIRNSHIVRLCVLGVIALILLIPVSMIRGLVFERQQRHLEASAEVTSKWGKSQSLVGPALVLPYTVRENQRTDAGIVTHESVRHAVFLPKRLKTDGTLNVEVRDRGIFHVPVYVLTLKLEGEFDNPKPEQLGIDSKDVDWSHAHFSMGISDVRALAGASTLSWNGTESDFLPGTGGLTEAPQGVHAPVKVQPGDPRISFSFPLTLHGSESVFVVPFAEETVIQLSSNFPHPNFQGNWLPATRTISSNGFEAMWQVSYLGRNYPQLWSSGTLPKSREEAQLSGALPKVIEDSQFGVTLNDPVDRYRLADRSVKYAGLFILLTFASVWLVEVLARMPVHPVQSLLLGAGLCMFYLLELSLSEHIGFSTAYGIASIAVIAMVAFYCRTIFRRNGRGGLVAGGVTLLYSYLYVVLTNEDAALLVGSVGVFVILAVIMFMTRRVRWYTEIPDEHAEFESPSV
jgi:inner membrane protein